MTKKEIKNMAATVFGIQTKDDEGNVYGVLLAKDKRTPVSSTFSLTREELKGLIKSGWKVIDGLKEVK